MPTGIPGKVTIICPDCGEGKEYHALGRCAICYWRYYRQKNPQAYMNQWGKWRENYPEGARVSSRRYYQAHRDDWQLRKARRKARKRALPDTLTPEQAGQLIEIGQAIYPGEKLHLDHITPLSKGGGTTFANMHAIPAGLNCSKGDILPQEVYRQAKLFDAF